MTITGTKPQKSARKAKGDGHLRRAEILLAAERIFVADGYEGATIRKIADEVGVSSTALYMHFRDKDEILLEICTEAMQSLLQINSDISAQPIDSVARVRMMLEAYVRFGLAHPNTYRLVFCTTPSPNSLLKPNSIQKQEATNEIGAQCFERFSGVVREIAAEGRLRTGDPKTVAQTLWVACHGMAAMMITKPSFDWAEPEEFMRVMVDGLLFGLVAD
ncbi:MAG TPA: TetR/AcrR family transcriptional regulator [Caulobacteraceae bacterium]|nr:TetR/AcrR family transcriptional regulator [Caulobacteraceae bacterium]